MANDKNKLNEKILKYKTALIAKAKKKGIWENFGQTEVLKLSDEYGFNQEIAEFDNWARNFDLDQLKGSK